MKEIENFKIKILTSGRYNYDKNTSKEMFDNLIEDLDALCEDSEVNKND